MTLPARRHRRQRITTARIVLCATALAWVALLYGMSFRREVRPTPKAVATRPDPVRFPAVSAALRPFASPDDLDTPDIGYMNPARVGLEGYGLAPPPNPDVPGGSADDPLGSRFPGEGFYTRSGPYANGTPLLVDNVFAGPALASFAGQLSARGGAGGGMGFAASGAPLGAASGGDGTIAEVLAANPVSLNIGSLESLRPRGYASAELGADSWPSGDVRAGGLLPGVRLSAGGLLASAGSGRGGSGEPRPVAFAGTSWQDSQNGSGGLPDFPRSISFDSAEDSAFGGDGAPMMLFDQDAFGDSPQDGWSDLGDVFGLDGGDFDGGDLPLSLFSAPGNPSDPVPEPSTVLLIAAGLFALTRIRRQ
jgi:hypothetical protein